MDGGTEFLTGGQKFLRFYVEKNRIAEDRGMAAGTLICEG